jgi:hypothetical protein
MINAILPHRLFLCRTLEKVIIPLPVKTLVKNHANIFPIV